MQVWRINAAREMELVKIDRTITDKEIKVKLTKAVITSTDMALYSGESNKYPIIPIGLAVGLISEAPKDTGFRIGERVIVSPYICSDTDDCNFSVMGCDIDGVLGDYCIVPKENVYLLPEGVSETDAVFVDYIAVAMKIIARLDVDKMQYVAIMGANALGIILAQICIYYQAIPIIIDESDDRLAIAEGCGIYYTINRCSEDSTSAVNSITGGNLADYTVVECKEGCPISTLYDYTKNGGIVAIVSSNNLITARWNIDVKQIFKKQLTVIGINNGFKEIHSAMNLLANGVLRLAPLVNDECNFDQAPELFERCLEGGTLVANAIINIK